MNMQVHSPVAEVAQVQQGNRGNAHGGSHSALNQNGGTFTLKSTPLSSLVAQSLEEMSFVSRETEKRSLQDRKKLADNHKVATLERVENYLKKVAEIHLLEKISRFIKLLENGPVADEELFRLLDTLDGNPTEKYCILEKLKQTAELAGNTDMAMRLAAKQEQLYESNRAAIESGFNVVDVAVSSAKDKELNTTTSKLTSFYCDAVLDYNGPAKAFKKIIEQYGESSFKSALDFIRNALGADIQAQRSSVTSEKLQAVMNDVKDIYVLNTLLDQCNQLIKQLRQP